MNIEWEDPPEAALVRSRGAGGKYLEFGIALREYPGRWAVLPTDGQRTDKGAAATAQNIKRGRVKGFVAGQYDTAVQGGKVWVRYNPPTQPAEAAQEDAGAAGGDAQDKAEGAPGKAKTADVRAWAQKQGLDVPDRGRLPEDVFDKYAEAVNRGEVGLPLRVVRHGGDAG